MTNTPVLKEASQLKWMTGNFENIAFSLTLLLLILHSGEQWYIKTPIIVLSMLALSIYQLRKNEYVWFTICAILIAANFMDRLVIDNHKYLITYWAICVYLSINSGKGEEFLSKSGKILIGLVFLFATLWKLISGDFVNYSFMNWALLTDERFAPIVHIFGGLHKYEYGLNYENASKFAVAKSIIDPKQYLHLISNSNIINLSKILTWWTIFIEMAIGIAFFFSKKRTVFWIAHILLMVFIITTYFPVPVIGFASILALMGFCAARKEPYLQFGYFIILVFVQIYKMPVLDFFIKYL